jgi:hypothetical protein
LGRRYQKTEGANTTRFLYNGLNPVQEQDALGAARANLLGGAGTDEYYSRTDAAGSRHLLRGSLGTTTALSDDTGAVRTRYSYEPFGQSSTVAGSDPDANSFLWTGREKVAGGRQYNRARYYSYAYVGNDPVDFSDPSGLILPMLAVSCAIGAVTNLVGDRMDGRKLAFDSRTLQSAAVRMRQRHDPRFDRHGARTTDRSGGCGHIRAADRPCRCPLRRAAAWQTCQRHRAGHCRDYRASAGGEGGGLPPRLPK